MKNIFKIAFAATLTFYILTLLLSEYVSVYITYIFIPVLFILSILTFGHTNNIYRTSKIAFMITLVLSVITISVVSYIGVYLVYIVLGLLFLSGIVMLLSK